MNDVNISIACNISSGNVGSSGRSYIGLLVTLLLVTVPALTANTVALYCIVPDWKRKRTLVKDLLLALCAADICGGVGVTIHHVTVRFDDVPDFMCAITSFLTTYFPLLSGVIATAMAAERCVALRAPYWYQENMFSVKMRVPFVAVVLIGTVICLFPQLGLGTFVKYKIKACLPVKTCGALPESQVLNVKKSVFSVAYGSIGLVMVALNVSFNMAVLRTLYQMVQRVNPFVRNAKDTTQEFEMTKMLLALSITFLICWVPMNLHVIFVQLGYKKYSSLTSIFMSLVGINFAADPFIYLLMKRTYREKVHALLCCRDVDVEETSDKSGSHRLATVSSNGVRRNV